ncbi:hypothetical protein ACFSC4_02250 [Deinococcus malanensis]|uniref:hypothetical protein n=1 Tax=Deinococcus malanensis TaxID=1706855 RepID=UPI00362F5380
MLALTLRGDLKDTGLAFALAYGANRVLQVVIHFALAREVPGGAPLPSRPALLWHWPPECGWSPPGSPAGQRCKSSCGVPRCWLT